MPILQFLRIFTDTDSNRYRFFEIFWKVSLIFTSSSILAQNGGKFGPPQRILDHREWQIVLFFSCIVCLAKPDNMLTKKTKYFADFYLFLNFNLTDTNTDFCIWMRVKAAIAIYAKKMQS